MSDKIRWVTYVSSEVDGQLRELAEEFGLSRAQLLNVVIKFGLSGFLRSYKPEKIFTLDQIAELGKKMGVEKEALPSGQESE